MKTLCQEMKPIAYRQELMALKDWRPGGDAAGESRGHHQLGHLTDGCKTWLADRVASPASLIGLLKDPCCIGLCDRDIVGWAIQDILLTTSAEN